MRNINLRYLDETYDQNGLLSKMSIHYPESYNFSYDVVDDIAAAEPDRPALVWCNPEGEEHRFSFASVKHWSDKTANFLQDQGIKYGDLVMVILRRHYQFWFVALALDKLGAVLVPATFMLKEHDLEYRINSAGIQTIICTDVGEIAQTVDNAMPLVGSLKTRILVNGGGGGLTAAGEADGLGFGAALSGEGGICALPASRSGWVDFNTEVRAASASFSPVASKASDPMIMYFSSGTSGNPKMVLHNSDYSLGHLGTAKHWQNVKSDGGIHFTIADTGWGKAVWGKLYGQWIMEACVFTYDIDRLEAGEILSLVERYGITTLCCPPTMYRLLMAADVSKYNLSSLGYSVCAGEALNPDLFASWRELTGLTLMDGFGQTETPVTVANLVGMTPKPGSMGKPIPLYSTKILDENDEECSSGQTGEICIAYPTAYNTATKPAGIMMEYYRDPDKTAEAIHDGWYHTGDTAWRDEDGYIFYVGRNDDVIKSSGYRISPFEIESVMLTHAAVAECAVTGVPDELRGKAVKATVVLAPGFEPGEALTKELQTFMKRETAPYKYPRIINYVEALPKTVNGKVRRAVIRTEDEQGTEAAQNRAPEEFGG
jgi:acetyl-CoA synthetase